MARKLRRLHHRLAAREAAVGIGAEIVGRVAVGELDQAPQRPQQVAHRLVDGDAAALGGPGLAVEIGADHLLFLRGVERSLDA